MLSVITRQDSDRKKKAFRILTIGLHVLLLVILVSAFQRLVLYESGYGLTLLRAYTHVFIPWLGVLLVLVIALDFSDKRELFLSMILFVACGFVLSLGAVNIERFIVRQNIQRTVRGNDFDIDYLRSLTVDAVPEIIRQYHAGDIPEDVRILLGVELVCRAERADLVNSRWVPRTNAFLKYNFADRQAYRKLRETKIELEEFTVSWDGQSEQWGVMYQNEFYECAPDMIQRYAGKS